MTKETNPKPGAPGPSTVDEDLSRNAQSATPAAPLPPSKEDAEAIYDLRHRILGLGENLMMRADPLNVAAWTGRECYAAARAYYLAFDRDMRAVAEVLGKEHPPVRETSGDGANAAER